ncbi:hypothetical protein Tco_0584469 [Tanacetum coccineum]
MCTYLKNMGGYKHNQLKGRSYEEIQKLFDKAYKQVSSFVPMDSELVKSSVTRTKGSSKRAGDELESDKSKKQKIDKHVEVKKDDQEEAEMKRHIEIVKDDNVAIDAIPLATKPPVIVEYKIDKDGRIGYFKLIRVDGSSKRYSSMIKMLQDIDREDLETLWKLVKAKHENTWPEEDYERVLWGDLNVMFEPNIKSEVWRNLQGYKVTIWKLFDNCGVHFVRFKNLHIFMLVEKRYPLTPKTITNMLNKKLQADHWNEINLKIQMMNIKFRGGLLGLKDFKMILRVTAAKLQLLSDYYCWKDYADRDEIQDGLENKNTYEDNLPTMKFSIEYVREQDDIIEQVVLYVSYCFSSSATRDGSSRSPELILCGILFADMQQVTA